MASPKTRPHQATIADWLSQPEAARLELIDGELVEKAAPTLSHGRAQGRTWGAIGSAYDHRGGHAGGPGGWWIATEVDVQLGDRGYRPDIAGWRRERLPELPSARPVTVRPDWICEVVSETNRATDTVKKLHRYHQAGVPHYWILDQVERTLTVHRHAPEGYLIALRAGAEEHVRPEPFEGVEIHVAVLLGDDPE